MKLNLTKNQIVTIYLNEDDSEFIIDGKSYTEKINWMDVCAVSKELDEKFKDSPTRNLWKRTIGLAWDRYKVMVDFELEVEDNLC